MSLRYKYGLTINGPWVGNYDLSDAVKHAQIEGNKLNQKVSYIIGFDDSDGTIDYRYLSMVLDISDDPDAQGWQDGAHGYPNRANIFYELEKQRELYNIAYGHGVLYRKHHVDSRIINQ